LCCPAGVPLRLPLTPALSPWGEGEEIGPLPMGGRENGIGPRDG
jgi:hypothetical protein